MKQPKFQPWRPPRIVSGRLDFSGCAPRGHVVLGILHGDHPAHAHVGTSLLAMGVARRASGIVLGEVMAVGDGCPGLAVGDVVVAQRASAAGRIWPGLAAPHVGFVPAPASGIDPEWFATVADAVGLERPTTHTDAGDDVPTHVAYHIVRAGNAVPAQWDGVDHATVDLGLKIATVKALMRRKHRAKEPDMSDPQAKREAALLARYEAELALVTMKRVGRAVNTAPVLAGLGTGEDGAIFDGVIAVLDGVSASA